MIFIKTAPAFPPILQKAFSPGTVTSVTNCRRAYQVQTLKGGSFIVKPLRIGARQAFLTATLLKGASDCPVLPRLFQTADYPYYFWDHRGRYLITCAVPGREADYWEDRDLTAAILGMGEFHRYTRQLITEKPAVWNCLRYQPLAEWERRYNEMERCRNRAIQSQDHWSKQYLKLWFYFSDQLYQALRELKTVSRGGPEVICYHDWAHHNVIIQNGLAALVDFDYMLVDRAVHDKVNLIARYLRLYNWSKEALLKIIWKFDRYYPWYPEELKLLRIYLLFPYDYWMLGRQYYLEKQPWSFKYYQDQWDRKVAPFREREKLLKLLEEF